MTGDKIVSASVSLECHNDELMIDRWVIKTANDEVSVDIQAIHRSSRDEDRSVNIDIATFKKFLAFSCLAFSTRQERGTL